MFSTLKLLLIYIPLGSLAGIFGIPWTLLTGNINLLYRVSIWIVRTGLKAAGIRIELTGTEHIPPGKSCIFMSNHVSNLDPPVTFPLLPGHSSVLLKKELMRIPILGTAMGIAKFVPVERGSKREAAQASVAAAAEALGSGLHMLVYPEGTRSRDGRLSTFKKGPFYLAQQTGAPIIPIAISGTEKMMQKGSIAIRPGVVRVQMLEAIDPAQYETREDLIKAVHAAIAAALPDEMKPADYLTIAL